MGVGNKVTIEEEQLICDLFANKHLSPTEIGKQINRDKTTVRRILTKNNIEYNTINYMTDIELNNIISDYQSGMTSKELGLKYHRSDGYIINLLKQHNVHKSIINKLSQSDWDVISELYRQGNNDKIYELYPTISLQSIYTKMSKLNIKSGRRNYWSEDDKQVVKDYYFTEGTDYIYEMINHRHSKDAIETYAFKELGYSKSKAWTDEEDIIFLNAYSQKSIDEVLTLLPNRTRLALQNRAKKYRLTSNYRLKIYWTDKENDYLISNWEKMSDYQIGQHLNRTASSVKERRNLLGLYRIKKELRGYESIKALLRARTWMWKQKSMEYCNYCCVITGSKDFHIHHLYGFNDIFNNFIVNNNISELDIQNYSFDELEKMCSEFIAFHNTYPLGVCIRSDLHILFHELYGKHNNSPEQWEEFVNYIKSNKIA